MLEGDEQEHEHIARAYALLLDRPDLDLCQFAQELGCDGPQARRLLDRLAEMSLLKSRENESRSPFVAVSPIIAMHELIAREHDALSARQMSLRQNYQTLSQLLPGYVERVQDQTMPPVTETIIGSEATQRRLEEMALAVRREVLSFSPISRDPTATRAASYALDLAILDRGVRMRTIYPDSTAYDSGALAYATETAAAGAEIRLVSELPLRLLVVDRATAIVPMDPEDGAEGCLVIHHRGTVHAFTALFDSHWRTGRELPDPDGRPRECSAMESGVLRLLAAGAKDEAVARQLSLSVRTVRRCIAELMTRAGASSRFELGVQALSRDWI